ncbi:Msa family membrane protein [Staphylococcus pseudintermedius]
MNKKYFYLFLINALIFFIGILINTKMSLFIFILISYIFPVISNNIINFVFKSTRSLKSNLLISMISTICYFVFSVYFISRPDFESFINSNQQRTGDISIEINPGLANIEQLIFVFLLNFISLFLVSLFFRKERSDVRNQKIK